MTSPHDAFDKAFFVPADVSLSAEDIINDADKRIARVLQQEQEEKFLPIGVGSRKAQRLPVL